MVRKLYSSKRKSGFSVGDEWFLKVYHDVGLKSYISSFRNLLYGSRPQRELRFSRFLRENGIDTVEVVKVKSRRFLRVFPVNVGFSKSRFIRGLKPLTDFIGDGSFDALLSETFKVSARLHSLRLVHGDLALSNFAVSGGKVYVIDLENMRRVFSRFRASLEVVDYIHDIYKELRRRGESRNLEELLELYLSFSNLRSGEAERLRRSFRAFFEKRGIEV